MVQFGMAHRNPGHSNIGSAHDSSLDETEIAYVHSF
jgi:hypothetical protein